MSDDDPSGENGVAVEDYLSRIDADDSPDAPAQETPPHPATLADLQQHHLRAVPFENLDIIDGVAITLDREAIAAKVIDDRRGGFCYELNGLFERLLDALGFETTLVSGRVTRPDGSLGPPHDHLAILVDLDEPLLVDVGFGDFARRPLSLSGTPISDVGGTYRVVADPDDASTYHAQSWDDEWETEYVFTTTPRAYEEFAEMCRFHQTDPASPFTSGPFVTRATEHGRLTLSASSLTVTEHGKKRKYTVGSAEEREHVLADRFGIER